MAGDRAACIRTHRGLAVRWSGISGIGFELHLWKENSLSPGFSEGFYASQKSLEIHKAWSYNRLRTNSDRAGA